MVKETEPSREIRDKVDKGFRSLKVLYGLPGKVGGGRR